MRDGDVQSPPLALRAGDEAGDVWARASELHGLKPLV